MSEHDRGMTASPLSDEPVHEAVHEAVHEPFVRSLDALGQWRATLEERVRDLARFLGEQGLLDENAGALLDSLLR